MKRPALLGISLFLLAIALPFALAGTFDVAPDAEQLTSGTSSGFSDLLTDNGANWVGTEASALQTTTLEPDSESNVKGSKTGTLAVEGSSDNDPYVTVTEGDQSSTSNLTPDSEVLTKANSVSGVLSDENTNNGVSRVVSEADQAVPSDLAPDTETVDKGSASGGAFPQTTDDGTTRDYLEADQTPANYQATLYANADGYTAVEVVFSRAL